MKIDSSTGLYRRAAALLAFVAAALMFGTFAGATVPPPRRSSRSTSAPSAAPISSARAVNDAGQVVGYSASASGESHAFSWTQAGGMVDLGTLGGRSSNAFAVNDAGQVVGTARPPRRKSRVLVDAGGRDDRPRHARRRASSAPTR